MYLSEYRRMLTHLNLLLMELGKPFVFFNRDRAIERKLQYHRDFNGIIILL